MMAVVVAPYFGRTDDLVDLVGYSVGENVEVVGWAYAHAMLYAVVRDDEGQAGLIPARAIRMLPNTRSVEDAKVERLRAVIGARPVMTNAVAGPPTATPRGVR